jgi:hypothetical protein
MSETKDQTVGTLGHHWQRNGNTKQLCLVQPNDNIVIVLKHASEGHVNKKAN